MSYPLTRFILTTVRNAKDLPPNVWDAFEKSPYCSNIMHAHAMTAASSSSSTEGAKDIWIVGWDVPHSKPTCPQVIFVLSCTTHPLGPYPIFLFTPLMTTDLVQDFVRPRILTMVRALRTIVPPERVFSVFAVDILAHTFADMWTAESGIQLANNPVYYHASLMYCDRRTLQVRQLPHIPHTITVLRPAVPADTKNAATLCHGFAQVSAPFALSFGNAFREAHMLIQKRQLWVHEVQNAGEEPAVASIVAVTRVTDSVAGITKVFTSPQWRSRGCAERLVRHVCQHLLRTKVAVVLYVAHNNLAAATAYGRVGFVGFSPDKSGEVQSWKELGFDRSRVRLGHW
ncbi:hypothetical protein C8Q80DRAFT_1215594 [Daedaleopsis nitida]|nr:hypothetical protein C8Q80DRAFT_1215594 [Daedaleopsis nitida]